MMAVNPNTQELTTVNTHGVLGIAPSGGGARGLAQLGVLKVFGRKDVPVSYVTGTSAGAIIGAVYATSADAEEAEARIMAHLQTTGVGFNADTYRGRHDGSPASAGLLSTLQDVWDLVWPHRSMIRSDAMRESLRTLLGDATFSDTTVPFATTALDLASGRRLLFAEGSLVDAVYASSAIPGLFQPLHLGDLVLVDGGWAEPVPVNACHHLGATHIIAVEMPRVERYRRGTIDAAAALRADALARDLLEDEQIAAADVVVSVDAPGRALADFSDPDGLIEAGERAAEKVIDDVRAVINDHEELFIRPTNSMPPAPSALPK